MTRVEQCIRDLESGRRFNTNEDRKEILLINLKYWENSMKMKKDKIDDDLEKFYIMIQCAQKLNYDPFISRL